MTRTPGSRSCPWCYGLNAHGVLKVPTAPRENQRRCPCFHTHGNGNRNFYQPKCICIWGFAKRCEAYMKIKIASPNEFFLGLAVGSTVLLIEIGLLALSVD